MLFNIKNIEIKMSNEINEVINYIFWSIKPKNSTEFAIEELVTLPLNPGVTIIRKPF